MVTLTSRLTNNFLSMNSHFRELLHGALIAFSIKSLSAVVTFAFNVVLARILGAEGVGIYIMSYTVIVIGSTLGQAGMGNPLVKFIASNVSLLNWTKVKGVYSKAIGISLCTSATIAVIIFISTPVISTYIFSEPKLMNPLRWMILALIPYTVYMLNANALKGLKKIAEAMTVFLLLNPFLVLIGAIILGPTWGVMGVVWAYVFSTIVTMLFGIFRWRAYTSHLRHLKSSFSFNELLSSSMPMFWVSIQQLLLAWSSTFILGIYSNSAQVGIFNVAQRTAMLVSFILIAVNSIAAPKFASLYHQGELLELEKLTRSSTKIMVIAALPPLLLFVFYSKWIMGIFGPEFVSGAVVLTILGVGQFVNVSTGSVSALITMAGYEVLWRNITAVAALINVILNILLIPNIGICGAAIATAIAVSTQMLIAVFFAWRKLKIMTIPFPFQSKLNKTSSNSDLVK